MSRPLASHAVRSLAAVLSIWGHGQAAALVGGASETSNPHSRPEVMIVGSRGNSCTGTLIARDLVLTAAHCVPASADYKLVDLDTQRRPVLRDIARIERHPQFSMETFLAHRATADVALVKLAAPRAVTPAAIISGGKLSISPGDRLTVAGYGLSDPRDGRSGGTLRIATLTVTGRPGNLQIRLMDPSARNERPGLGACTGDSGAPAWRETDLGPAVIGVVSWSTAANSEQGCGGLTGITPLSLYRPWITEAARKLGSPLPP